MPPSHVYVHVPFCARRCSYCDFAIAVRSRVPTDEYLDALAREMKVRWPDAQARPVRTIYFGGGTPSRLGVDGVARAVAAVAATFPPETGAELTLEANPDDVTPAAVAAWGDAGINRVSLGVQSFDDRALAWMHRTHDAARAVRAAHVLRDGGIDDWSLDLIFSLPAELERSWERDVATAIDLDPPHISLYGLTIETHTPVARWRDRGLAVEGDEDAYEREYLHANAALTSAGYEHYEVSNFSRPRRRSRHNSGYWNTTPYVGLGPAAHGFDGDTRRWNAREYAEWVRLVGADVDPIAGSESLTEENRRAEEVYLGLRTNAGLRLDPSERVFVEPWGRAGWAVIDDRHLRLTPPGWLRLDSLAASLTMLRSR